MHGDGRLRVATAWSLRSYKVHVKLCGCSCRSRFWAAIRRWNSMMERRLEVRDPHGRRNRNAVETGPSEMALAPPWVKRTGAVHAVEPCIYPLGKVVKVCGHVGQGGPVGTGRGGTRPLWAFTHCTLPSRLIQLL